MQVKRPSPRKAAWPVALFFLALLALGLLTAPGYGQPWDEPWEQDILRMNLNQYLAVVGSETRLTLTSSVEKPAGGLITDSVERDHGECAYYPAFLLVTDATLTDAQRMTLWHAYTWLWFMAGAAAQWCIARRLGLSRLLSAAAVLTLVLSPRMFAEGHYNNKDFVLLALGLLTLWQAMRLMEKPVLRRAVWFALVGAAAANTKIVGLAFWGLCALFVLLRQIAGKRMTQRVFGVGLMTLLLFAGFYALLTPALWADPLGYLRYTLGNAAGFSRWNNEVLFRGTLYMPSRNPLPRLYLPWMIVLTTPLWILALIGIGQLLTLARLCRKPGNPLAEDVSATLLLCTLLWVLPLGYAVLAQPNVYNGWRHFYFLYGPMLALAAYGLGRLRALLDRPRTPTLRRVGAGILALFMGMTAALMATAYPNEYTYYNALTLRSNLPEAYELDYWNVSALHTLRAAADQVPADRSFSITGSDFGSQNGLASAWKLLPEAQRARLRVLPLGSIGATYTLSNTTYAAINGWKPKAEQPIIAQTRSFGQPLTTVYARIQP